FSHLRRSFDSDHRQQSVLIAHGHHHRAGPMRESRVDALDRGSGVARPGVVERSPRGIGDGRSGRRGFALVANHLLAAGQVIEAGPADFVADPWLRDTERTAALSNVSSAPLPAPRTSTSSSGLVCVSQYATTL